MDAVSNDNVLPTASAGSNLSDELFGASAVLNSQDQYSSSTSSALPSTAGAVDEVDTNMEGVESTSAATENAIANAGADENDEDGDEDDLFGDGDDDEDDDKSNGSAMEQDEKAASVRSEDDAPEEDLSEDEVQRRARLEYPESDGEDAAKHVRASRLVAEVPLINCGLPAESKVWHARLPNYLSLVKTAYKEDDESTWFNHASAGSSGAVEAGEASSSAAGDQDRIRWRWVKDPITGEVMKQSNSRVVRWSDGSLTLQIGGEQYAISASLDHTAAVFSTADSTAATPSTATPLSQFDSSRGHGLTYLSSHQSSDALTSSGANIIETHASIHGTLTFRPMTTQGKTHQRLAGAIAVKYVKPIAMKMHLTEVDPEKKRVDREREEMEKMKQAKKEKMALRKGTKGGSTRRGNKRSTRLVMGDSDDEDEDGAGGSGEGENGGEDDDERGDGKDFRGSRSNPKRGRGGPLARGSDEEEEEAEDDFVVADNDDDEDEPERVGAGSRRKLGDVKGDGLDDVDVAEARIERTERKRKSNAGAAPAEPVMEVRRRLVIEDEDDE